MADEPRTEMEVQAEASRDGLSLKAKGAGLFVLLALDIAGMVWIGYGMIQKDAASTAGVLAFVLLFFLAMQLTKILAAVLGLRVSDD